MLLVHLFGGLWAYEVTSPCGALMASGVGTPREIEDILDWLENNVCAH